MKFIHGSRPVRQIIFHSNNPLGDTFLVLFCEVFHVKYITLKSYKLLYIFWIFKRVALRCIYYLKTADLLFELAKINEWRLQIENTSSNRGATLIAHSIIEHDHHQSYVTIGISVWLQTIRAL